MNLTKFDPQHVGRALALLSVLSEAVELPARRVLIPLSLMVLWEYAPGRTERAAAALRTGAKMEAAELTRYSFATGDPLYVPNTEYHQYIAAQQLGLRSVWAIPTCEYPVKPERFYVDGAGLWRILGITRSVLVTGSASIANELPILLELGVMDWTGRPFAPLTADQLASIREVTRKAGVTAEEAVSSFDEGKRFLLGKDTG